MIAYITLMVAGSEEQKWCWKGYAYMPEMWILLAPMMLALGVKLNFELGNY